MLLADLNQRQRAPQSPVHRINSSHRTTQRARIDRVFNLVRVSPIVQELFNVLRVYVCVVYLCKIFDFFKVFISFPKCISSLAHWAMSACMIDFEDLCPDIQTQQTESCLCYFLHSRPNQDNCTYFRIPTLCGVNETRMICHLLFFLADANTTTLWLIRHNLVALFCAIHKI